MRSMILLALVSAYPMVGAAQEYGPPEWTVRLSALLEAGGAPLLVRALHNNRSSAADADWVQLRYGVQGMQVGLLVSPSTALEMHELLWLQDNGAIVAADRAVPTTLIARVHVDYRRTLTFVCEAACGDRGPYLEVAELSDQEADRLNMTLQAMAAELGARRETSPVAQTPVRPAPPSSPRAAPVTGRLTVNTAPRGTLVIDGEPVGETPVIQLALPIGSHEVRVRREGYDAVLDTVTVRATGTARRSYRLQRTTEQRILDAGGGTLNVASQPEGIAYMDDQRLGETPLSGIAVRAGVHELRIERPGYAAVTDTILILGGTTLRRLYRLQEAEAAPMPVTESVAPVVPQPTEPAEGSLTITATPEASVWVDGRHVGETPIVGMRLTGGMHILELVKDGYRSLADTVEVRPGGRVRKMYALLKRDPRPKT